MTKIAKIEISDFRVYRNTQTFSFDENGKIANLVVIYAPNGYGKTSFFDAVEWVYSDQIARFERGTLKDEVSRRDFASGDQILLTNRKSYLEGKDGVVKITVDDGRTLSRKVDRRKISKQDKYHDYRPGIFNGDNFQENELKTLPNTNLLTQDQIDSFLRYTTPEDKFTALSKFWKEGGSAINIVKNITGYMRVLRNGRDALQGRSSLLHDAISNLLNTQENISKVNASITALSNSKVLEFKVDPVTHPIAERVYQSLKEAVVSYIKRGQRLMQAANERKATLQELLNTIVSHLGQEERAQLLAGQVKTIDGLQKLFVDQATFIKERGNLQQNLAKNSRLLEDFQKLSGVWAQFLDLKKQIAKINQELTALLQDNEQQILKASIYKNSLNSLDYQRDKWLAEIKSLQSAADAYTDNYRQYVYWKSELDGFQKKLAPLERTYTNKNQQAESLSANRQHWQIIAETEDLSRLRDSESAEFHELLDEIQSARQLRQDFEAELLISEERFKQSGSLNEDLDRILIWGENYVNATDSTSCPLCKTEFQNINELLDRIRLEKTDVLAIAIQQEAITKLQERIGEQNKRYNNSRDTILGVVREWLSRCEKSLANAYAEREQLNKEVMEVRGQVFHATEQFDDYRERISLESLGIEATERKSPEKVKEELETKVAQLRTKELRLRELIAIKRGFWETADNLASVNRNKQASLENTLSLNTSDVIFVDARELASRLQISEEDTLANITRKVEETKTIIETDRTSSEVLTASIKIVQESISAYPLQRAETELPGEKIDLKNEIEQLNTLIAAFKHLYAVTLPETAIDAKEITSAQEENYKLIDAIGIELGRLDQLLIQVELITENINKTKFENELGDIKKKLLQFDAAEQKLADAQAAAVSYIDHEINNYFNRDVINQIYSRIEPHPDLNMIEFIPDFEGRNFVVDVRASGKTDNVNPVLYLSAGQLNVLSLSIFLATIFESGNEVISTIFMDDPVQNLSDINILSFIDLIRSMVVTFDKQIVISTHDEHFYKLIQHKIPSSAFDAKYIELGNFGIIREEMVV